jgi:N-acetylglucosaminyldiphosphoundecaprenol N-acetyl-beta-D-mannosaminyltransferase
MEMDFTMARQRLLVLDDDQEIGEIVAITAQSLGMDCIATSDSQEFVKALRPDVTLILLDLVMPKVDGIEILRLLGEQRCRAGIIVMSGVGKRVVESAESLATMLGLSIVDHLIKPFSIAQLEETLLRTRKPEIEHRPTPDKDLPFNAIELSRAVDKEEFVLHYQPQIEIATGRCLGVEVLVRWQRPDFGLIGPDGFIDFAEELDLIDDLTWFVIKRGMSEMWACNHLGDVRVPRIAGVDLIEGLCERGAADGLSVFLLGGRPNMAEETARKLSRRNPGLRIAGVSCPDWGFETHEETIQPVLEQIAKAKPHIVFVALGAPKQEFFIDKFLRPLNVPIAIGVGGSFEILSGAINRAPLWMQSSGFEWAYRLFKDPGRLWKRYLIGNAEFVASVAIWKLRTIALHHRMLREWVTR